MSDRSPAMKTRSRRPARLRLAALMLVTLVLAALCSGAWEARQINLGRDLIAAILDFNPERAASILRSGADPNTLNDFTDEHVSLGFGLRRVALILGRIKGGVPHGKSALALAIQRRQDGLYRQLLEHGARPDLRDYYGRTPLEEAAKQGRADVARDLIARGANPLNRDAIGLTPMREATNGARAEVIQVLRAHGAPDSDLLDGAFLNRPDIIRHRIGIDPINLALPDGRTALDVAASFGNTESVRALLAAGADMRHLSRGSIAVFGDWDTADVRRGGTGGLTPLMWAAGSGVPEIVKLLLDNGADPTAHDTDGRTALHWAALSPSRHAAIFSLLLARGIPVEAQDSHGVTALMLEVSRRGDGAGFLIGHGASPARLDQNGRSARDIAVTCGHALSSKSVRMVGDR